MAETTTYQCPNCSGRMSYDGGIGRLRCEFCESTFTPEEVEAIFAERQAKADAKAAQEAGTSTDSAYAQQGANAGAASFVPAVGGTGANEATPSQQTPKPTAAQASTSQAAQVKPTVALTGDPIKDYIAQSKWTSSDADNMRAYNCSSCGAQLMVDQVTAVTSCPYCGNNAVVPGQLADVLKPDYVIPFKLDKEAAVQALKRYYGGKPLLPNSFTANNHIEEIQGLYVPFWLYSGTGNVDATFEGRNIRTWSDSENIYTETDHFELYRSGTMQFKAVPVDGSTKMPDAHMDAIEPFDYSELTPFSIAYLPGYITDRYDLDVKECDSRARGRVTNTCSDMIAQTATGFMESNMTSSDADITWTNISYALLPVWMLHTKWNGQDYLFAMNGQTGKFIGDLPIDNGKVVKRFLMMFAPLLIIIVAIIIFVFGGYVF